jgi:argininosuccinate lyase
MLPAIHAFDKAHTVMLVEEGLLERAAGAAILRGLRSWKAKVSSRRVRESAADCTPGSNT